MRRHPRMRQPYGPRERRAYVEPYGHLVTQFAPQRGYERIAHPMPHGGYRYVAICPGCLQRRTKLYPAQYPIMGYRCRVCLGMAYHSQYQGRRVEASKERLDLAREHMYKADGRIDEQRLQRYCDASDRWGVKMDRDLMAQHLDYMMLLARMLAILDREPRQRERRRIYMWRYRRGWRAGDQMHLVPPPRAESCVDSDLDELRASLEAARSA